VSDLGVDVEPAVFVEKVQEMRPHILGMSALMSTTQGSMDETVRLLREVGLRSNLKVILGGAVASQRYANEIGADQAVNDAVQGVDICNSWVKPLKSR
jgi:methanogenic corrinoid protein MtbC1